MSRPAPSTRPVPDLPAESDQAGPWRDGLRFILCSHNEHKRSELERALPGWRIELLEENGFPEEVGQTFYENARGKAQFGRTVGPPGVWMLGEDSGLEVDALGGGPGIETARWAQGRHVERVLEALQGQDDRGARYVCELVALAPHGRELRGTGLLEGAIARRPRGAAGFGFDPVFVPVGNERTVAELGEDWKARHSHRALAALALRTTLESTLA
jgi:XTP/dITP diphosphohydrolase